MKCKKIVSTLLASAIITTSVFTGDFMTANAATVGESMPTPVATYTFDGTLSSKEGATAKAYAKKYGAYSGDITYVAGRNAAITSDTDDKAVQLGSYGLELAEKNIGTEYTVSCWVKPDGTIANNMPVIALGYHTPELWTAISGDGGTNACKVWANDKVNNKFAWKTLGNMTIPSGEWSMVTLSQTAGTLSMYLNGNLVGTAAAPDIMNGENAAIDLGVNNWDDLFTGQMDDVSVYNRSLTATQVRYLYDGKDEETVFKEEGFTVTDELTMFQKEKRTITVTLPSAVAAENATISYQSKNEDVATVDNGTVTGVGVGETTITTSVKVGATTLTKDTTVTVESSDNLKEGIAAEYDLTQIVDGKLKDVSGRGNDAAVEGESGISFVKEDGKTVMKMASNDSYIKLPLSIMDSLTDKEQFTIETTFAKSSACGNNAWLFCLGSKVKNSGTNYMFLSPNFESKTLRAGIKDSGTEKLFGTSIQPAVDTYYTVDMVFNKGTVKLYWNGQLIKGDDGTELKSGYSIMDDVVTPGTENGILGYIGKSCWAPDKNYQGKVASFKIYDKAMTDEEIQLSDPKYQEALEKNLEDLTVADILSSNASASEVKYNLNLPATLNEIAVTWTSDKPEVVSAAGVVTNGTEDTEVKLTATITTGALKATKDFNVTVKALDKSELTTTIANAQALINDPYIVADSVSAVQTAIRDAANVATQSDVDKAVKKINKAMNKVEYVDTYVNPFEYINSSSYSQTAAVAVGGTARVFTLPDSIKDTVTVSYASANTDIAAIDANGVVTGLKDGYASVVTTVTAKYDGFKMEYQTVVTVGTPTGKVITPEPQVITVTAAVKDATIVKGQTTQVTVTAPAGATVTYRAKGAVAVTSTGTITGKKGGTGTVYATVIVNGKKAVRKVTVNVGDISGKGTVKVKKSLKLSVKGISGKVKWSVNKKKLATISSKGVLKAKKKGKVTVTAKVGNYTMKKTITIKK